MQVFTAIVDVIVALISHFASKEIAFAVAFSILLASLGIWATTVYWPHRSFKRSLRDGIGKITST